jgi:hypothetical protein
MNHTLRILADALYVIKVRATGSVESGSHVGKERSFLGVCCLQDRTKIRQFIGKILSARQQIKLLYLPGGKEKKRKNGHREAVLSSCAGIRTAEMHGRR